MAPMLALEHQVGRPCPSTASTTSCRPSTTIPSGASGCGDPAVRAGTLLDDEAEELRRADAVMRGRRHGEEAFLVLEASFAIGLDDVARAHRRAELLAATGVTALPVVAGDSADPETQAAARRLGVWQVTDGQVVPPTGAAA
jgi:hypothetical protein